MTDTLGPLISFQPPVTPALVVRRAALEANLATMQAACSAAGAALRAHGKMHKCTTLGRRQIELGAVGLCCQTVGEAQAYAAAGVSDLLITSPPAPWGAEKIAAIAKSGVNIAVVADDAEQIARLGAAAQGAGTTIGLVVDIDLGTHRTGVPPE
ncbi:MAG: alanine racemase, partial [Phenylobacterium sp.]